MASSVAITVLINRLFVFIFLFVSLMVLATNKVTTSYLTVDDNPSKVTFKNSYAYRFLLSVAVIGCAYTLLQIPFAALSISNRTEISQFVIFPDLVFTPLFAMAVGAGFGLTVDVKHFLDKLFASADLQDDPELKDVDKFFDHVYVSAGFLLLATVFMVVMTILSVHAVSRK
ncbi:CASP-like protein 4D1 [Elaeis guineensis]|uniref:CASP-like protein n=1 Tax=Elaeis guineensis var. tenera TaxID=51953 RepID=A0A6I9S3A8_ELAGV|nr:CASP-like protein 4D1 [Elaeis guineensis]